MASISEHQQENSIKELKPFSLPIVGASFNLAAKMVMSKGGRIDGEKWNVFELMRYMIMVFVWLSVWVLKLLLDHFPSPLPFPCTGFLENIVPTGPVLLNAEELPSNLGPPSGRAIGRALSQVLALVNDIPVTSRKYDFARDLADKIIEENAKQGEHGLQEINRMALSASFARTLKLLNSSLHGMQRDVETSGWTWKLIRMIPLYSQLMPSLENLWASLANRLQLQPPTALSTSQNQTMMANTNSVFAEKLAQELLWITNKLQICLAMEEAILQWSSATNLAAISVSAHPRVQGSLVKISALLFKQMVKGDIEISEQSRFKSLILWLPLLCYAMNGIDSPVLSGLEKAEVERVLERIISSLSEMDQEIILANWLHDYTFSSSDWPNLQKCYDAWCHSSRKIR